MWTHINMMFYSDFIYNINLYDDKPVRLLNTTYSVNLEAEKFLVTKALNLQIILNFVNS